MFWFTPYTQYPLFQGMMSTLYEKKRYLPWKADRLYRKYPLNKGVGIWRLRGYADEASTIDLFLVDVGFGEQTILKF